MKTEALQRSREGEEEVSIKDQKYSCGDLGSIIGAVFHARTESAANIPHWNVDPDRDSGYNRLSLYCEGECKGVGAKGGRRAQVSGR